MRLPFTIKSLFCSFFVGLALVGQASADEIAIYKGTIVETSSGYQGADSLSMALSGKSKKTTRFYLVRNLSATRRAYLAVFISPPKGYSVDAIELLPLDVMVAEEGKKTVEYVQLNDLLGPESSTTSSAEFRNHSAQVSGVLKPLDLKKATPPVTLGLVAKSLKGKTIADVSRFGTMTDERFGFSNSKVTMVLDKRMTQTANDASDPLDIVEVPGTLLYGAEVVRAALNKKGFEEK